MVMTDGEIEIASKQLFAQDREARQKATETTPPALTPSILAFCQALGGVPAAFIPVVSDPLGRYGWCSDGVRLKVAADGGAPVYGWTIWEWPPAIVTAEFHCVWRSPQGDLVDITPKPADEKTILFVEDPSYGVDFDFDLRPRNRRVRIYEPTLPDPAALIAGFSETQRAYETRRATKANLSLEDWLAQKAPKDPMPDEIDAFIALCAEYDVRIDAAGSNEIIETDPTFRALVRHRMEVEGRIRTWARAYLTGRGGV